MWILDRLSVSLWAIDASDLDVKNWIIFLWKTEEMQVANSVASILRSDFVSLDQSNTHILDSFENDWMGPVWFLNCTAREFDTDLYKKILDIDHIHRIFLRGANKRNKYDSNRIINSPLVQRVFVNWDRKDNLQNIFNELKRRTS